MSGIRLANSARLCLPVIQKNTWLSLVNNMPQNPGGKLRKASSSCEINLKRKASQ